MHIYQGGNHLSDEDPLLSNAVSDKEDHEQIRGSSNSQSRERLDRTVQKLIKLKIRGLKIRAELQENVNKKFADDEDLMTQL